GGTVDSWRLGPHGIGQRKAGQANQGIGRDGRHGGWVAGLALDHRRLADDGAAMQDCLFVGRETPTPGPDLELRVAAARTGSPRLPRSPGEQPGKRNACGDRRADLDEPVRTHWRPIQGGLDPTVGGNDPARTVVRKGYGAAARIAAEA